MLAYVSHFDVSLTLVKYPKEIFVFLWDPQLQLFISTSINYQESWWAIIYQRIWYFNFMLAYVIKCEMSLGSVKYLKELFCSCGFPKMQLCIFSLHSVHFRQTHICLDLVFFFFLKNRSSISLLRFVMLSIWTLQVFVIISILADVQFGKAQWFSQWNQSSVSPMIK